MRARERKSISESMQISKTGEEGIFMAVTLQQIAEAAGVSRGTVDRALNNRGRINPEVADNIRRIAQEMGYQPNRAGRALAMSRHFIKIGVIIQAADTPFMKHVLSGAMEAKVEIERLGAEVFIKKIKGVDVDMVLETMERMRREGFGGIALTPVEDERLIHTVNELAEGGIPIVTFNSDLEGSKRMCFIGQNTRQSGRVAAGLMAEILPPDTSVQIISGYPSNHSHKNRSRAFAQELAECRRDVAILDLQYDYDEDGLAEKITEEMLKEYRNLAGIYLAASGSEGVCRALRKKGLVGKVKVISNDLTQGNLKELSEGAIQFLLGQNARIQGYTPVMTLFNKLFDGKNPEEECTYTEIVIKTRHNID